MSRQFTIGILVAVVLVPGCGDVGIAHRPGGPERYHIAPVPTQSGLAGRSVVECPAGPCIVLHFPPYEMNPQESREMEEFVARMLIGDPSTTADDGELFRDEQHRWCAETDGEVMQSTFNCCTFAVGDVVGLTADDWIMPLECGQADGTFPMQVVLDSYFELAHQYRVDGRPFDWARIESDAELQQDDVLCFVQTLLTGGTSTRIVHAGRIWKHKGRNWIASKIGAGPILMTPIETLAREFGGQFDVVRIHRPKGQDG
jgi:hypothetical protein